MNIYIGLASARRLPGVGNTRHEGRAVLSPPPPLPPPPSSLINHAKQRPRGIAGAGRRRGGGFSPGPVPTGRPTRLAPRGRWGGYGGGGLLTAPPAPAGAGPGVALKIHHEVMDKKKPTPGAGGGTRHSPAGPPRCAPAGGTAPHRPASRTGARGCSDLRRRDRETTAGAGGRAAGVTRDTACPRPLGRG